MCEKKMTLEEWRKKTAPLWAELARAKHMACRKDISEGTCSYWLKEYQSILADMQPPKHLIIEKE